MLSQSKIINCRTLYKHIVSSRNDTVPVAVAEDSFCSASADSNCGSYVISFTLFSSRSISNLNDYVTTTINN